MHFDGKPTIGIKGQSWKQNCVPFKQHKVHSVHLTAFYDDLKAHHKL